MLIHPNKFYKCERHLLVYPSKEKAMEIGISSVTKEPAYWPKESDLPFRIGFLEKNTAFLVLETNDDEYIKVLCTDIAGWIIYIKWIARFEEVK